MNTNTNTSISSIDLTADPFPGVRLDEVVSQQANRSERWLRHAADGEKQLCLPEARHLHWLECQRLVEVILTVGFRHWNHDYGPRAEALPSDQAPSEVAQTLLGDDFYRWFGEDDSKGYTPTVCPSAIQAKSEELAKRLIREVPVDQWPETHHQRMQDFMDSDFAGSKLGLEAYYDQQKTDAPLRAQQVTAKVDELLFTQLGSEASVHDIQKGLNGMLAVLKETLKRYQGESTGGARSLQEARQRIEEAHRRYAAVGELARRLDAKRGEGRTFEIFAGGVKAPLSCAQAHTQFHQTQLHLKAIHYGANDYLPRLVQGIAGLAKVFKDFSDALQALQKRAGEQIKECAAGNVPPDFSANTVEIVEPKAIEATVAALHLDRAAIEETSRQALKVLIESSKATRLSDLAALQEAQLEGLLRPVCATQAVASHQRLIQQQPALAPLLGSHIVTELRRLGHGGIASDLRQNLALALKSASPFLPLQDTPIPLRLGAAIGHGQSPARTLLVLLPDYPEDAAFHAQLANELRHATTLDMTLMAAQGEEARTSIIVISHAYYFPLRFALPVHELHHKVPVESVPWHAWTFPHSPASLPSLFLPTDQQIKADALPYLLILLALGRLKLDGHDDEENLVLFQPSALDKTVTDWEQALGIPASQQN